MNDEIPINRGTTDGWGTDWHALLENRKKDLASYPDIWICQDGTDQKLFGPFLTRSEAGDCWMDISGSVVMHMPSGSRVEIGKNEMHVPEPGDGPSASWLNDQG